MKAISHDTHDEAICEYPADYARLAFVISAPRGGAIAFSRRMERLGELGLPHTHLAIRSEPDAARRVTSRLALYGIDDGLIRSLSAVIYGGFEAYQLESAHHDLTMMYSRNSFEHAYQRLLANCTQEIYDPSFSLSLFPELITPLEARYPGSRFIYVFRDPYFYATSVLTSVHGLDSLLVWWSIAREKEPSVPLDPLVMWCNINEGLLESESRHARSGGVRVLRFPESERRLSFERIGQFCSSEYANYPAPGASPCMSSRLKSSIQGRLYLSRQLGRLIDSRTQRLISVIGDRTPWWHDITLGGDPSVYLRHYSSPRDLVPAYWSYIEQNSDTVERCDELCGRIGFPTLSRRLGKQK